MNMLDWDVCAVIAVVNSKGSSNFIILTLKIKKENKKMTEEEKVAKEEEEKAKVKLKEKKAQQLKEQGSIEEIQLEQINEMKTKMDGMVDSSEYNKLKNEYSKALNELVNKRPAPDKEKIKTRPVKEIAKEISSIGSGDIANREYIAKSLEYRNAYIKEFGTDPFADFGQEGSGSSTDDTSEVATVLQTLLDENPSPVDFRIKLNSVLKDDQKLVSKLRKRK
jgi:phage tail tape-measure protein